MEKFSIDKIDTDFLSIFLKESIESRKETKKHFQTPNFKQPTSYKLYKASSQMFNSNYSLLCKNKENKMIKVTRQRQACMREDFLVRGIGKRAIHVVIPFDATLTKPVSEILSEFELYWLIVGTAQSINKKYGWKHVIINLPYISSTIASCVIYVSNPARYKKALCSVGQMIDLQHFTNDNYLCPKNFFIPEYKPQQKN